MQDDVVGKTVQALLEQFDDDVDAGETDEQRELRTMELAAETLTLNSDTRDATFTRMTNYIFGVLQRLHPGALENLASGDIDYTIDTNRQRVHLVPAAIESEMLIEHGRRKSPRRPELAITAPPCVMGNECRGLRGAIRGFDNDMTGVVLMQRMLPDELERFYTTGSAPSQARMCVLCHRFHVFSMTLDMSQRASSPPTLLLSDVGNQYGVPGEYRREMCILPMAEAYFNGLLHPLAKLDYTSLEAFKDPDTGKWCISQRDMLVPESSSASVVPATEDGQADETMGVPYDVGSLEELVNEPAPATRSQPPSPFFL